ncbi:hypothetical protein BC938DRAFT_473663 [Jimgerdemannia flammicorona]|uniref:Uncharacterized protein n=1 Tax=Jimgerdemannia flammicorona TaxID=994334 RepID=A0A433QT45_9FUNG|nr:hypothetical protein BC938DRAFT_473663 [Jimgerdemannia flammicorona]
MIWDQDGSLFKLDLLRDKDQAAVLRIDKLVALKKEHIWSGPAHKDSLDFTVMCPRHSRLSFPRYGNDDYGNDMYPTTTSDGNPNFDLVTLINWPTLANVQKQEIHLRSRPIADLECTLIFYSEARRPDGSTSSFAHTSREPLGS